MLRVGGLKGKTLPLTPAPLLPSISIQSMSHLTKEAP